ncbi:iron-containing redox enzyme family protein [Streptomyces mirabilis]|uniref:iron-containing redox enzyme family protein n=1 Tax=Streptomyces mirabilis TaxID=68239 RepID=UPI003D9F0753
MSLFGAPSAARRARRTLRRRRGDLVPASRRLAEALRRVGAGPAAVRFYTEHVEADVVHERVVRHDVARGLEREPQLEADVVFGIRATTHLEDRLAVRLLSVWREGSTALHLRTPGTSHVPGHHSRSCGGSGPKRRSDR